MAVNLYPWVKNLEGGDPTRLLLPVQAGSTATIKRGEICKMGENAAGYMAPVDAANDTTGLAIADQEQKSDDVERMIYFIIPKPGDIFEFEMTAARAVAYGETFAISTSQKLAYATSNVVFRSGDDSNYPEPEEKSITKRSVSHVRGSFDEQASYYLELTGNS